ncbi:MAG TPA: hypothetical protein VIG71_09680 [Enteractinococcus sp.]
MTKDNLTKEEIRTLLGNANSDGSLRSRASTDTSPDDTRVVTGDPERDKLLEMPMSDFEAVLNDPDHELAEKARQLSTEIAKRIAYAIRPWGIVHPEVRKKFFDFVSMPSFATGMIEHNDDSHRGILPLFELLMPGVKAAQWVSSSSDVPGSGTAVLERSAPGDVQVWSDDLDDFVVPGKEDPVIAHIRGWEEFALRLDALYMTQEQARLDAVQASSKALLATEVAKRTAKRSLWIAVGAALVAAASAILPVIGAA